MNDWYQEGRAYKLFDDENRVLRLENTASIDQYPKQLIVCAGPTRRLRRGGGSMKERQQYDIMAASFRKRGRYPFQG